MNRLDDFDGLYLDADAGGGGGSDGADAAASGDAAETEVASESAETRPAAPRVSLDDLPDLLQREVRASRREAARFREEARRYASVYEGLPAEATDFLLDLNRALTAEDPKPAVEMLERLLEQFKGQRPAGSDEDDVPLTRAEMRALLDERDRAASERAQSAATAEAVEEIKAEAKALGYDPDADPDSDERDDYLLLIDTAERRTRGDLAAADALIRDRQARRASALTEQKRTRAATTITPPSGGAAPSTERRIANLKDAKRSLEDRLAAAG